MTNMDIGSPASLADTFKELLDGGAAIEQVLPAFTSNVARLLRLRDKGRIAVDASADFLVLADDNTISDVIVAGAWHVRDGEQQIFGQFETEAS